MILRFPDGVQGGALLLMRFSCAAAALSATEALRPSAAGSWLPTIAALALATPLLLGFCARAASAALSVALATGLVSGSGQTMLTLAATMGALAGALLGPGAWSLDAHLHGRRVIRLDPRSPDRGSPG